MAQIVEEIILIRLSRIVKDSETAPESIVTDEVTSTLETVTQEIFGNSVVVEVEAPVTDSTQD
jgi:hypothetical protein